MGSIILESFVVSWEVQKSSLLQTSLETIVPNTTTRGSWVLEQANSPGKSKNAQIGVYTTPQEALRRAVRRFRDKEMG